ncbi:MAG: hypothetical protein ABI895_37300 [Deltaproteobacteria bacterium]
MQSSLVLPMVLASTLTLHCDSNGAKCAIADYSECGSPLPATQPGGEPWPTFSQALLEAQTCGSHSSLEFVLRGACADGKQSITRAGGFGGGTLYFRGEQLVGVARYTDVGGEPCQCPFESFQGSLETVRCDGATFEALCADRVPEDFSAPFSQGTAACECDDPPR